jgi:hypothetical protein
VGNPNGGHGVTALPLIRLCEKYLWLSKNHLLDFDIAVGLMDSLYHFVSSCLTADELDEDQPVRVACPVVGIVQTKPRADIATVFGENPLDFSGVFHEIGNMNAKNQM